MSDSNENVVLFQVRVMFKFFNAEVINFKIITDTDKGINSFIDKLKQIKDIEKISVEYLCQYDCSRLGEVKNIDLVEVDSDEKI